MGTQKGKRFRKRRDAFVEQKGGELNETRSRLRGTSVTDAGYERKYFSRLMDISISSDGRSALTESISETSGRWSIPGTAMLDVMSEKAATN